MTTFKVPNAEENIAWTGERFVVGLEGEIALEHYHRYLFATQFCGGCDVLDIACGKGYGSFLLSQAAKSVTGVDVDIASMQRARNRYRAPNVSFAEGSCSNIALPDKSIDVIICFETIEHISDPGGFLLEVRRVLRDRGLLIASTPNRVVFQGHGANPFHTLEYSEEEFTELLSRHFRNLIIGVQKATCGSVILSNNASATQIQVFSGDEAGTFESTHTFRTAPFLLAIAADSALPPIQKGILEDESYLKSLHVQCEDEQRARKEVNRQLAQVERCLEDEQRARQEAAVQHDTEMELLHRQLTVVQRRLNAIETSSSWRLMTKIHRVMPFLRVRRSPR
jgi:ubiquinone/menaquinone biosynthesis C-methylase UbiE